MQPVVVKKYANRRLYNTESSSYITLDNLADMVRAGRDFVVYDARTGDDITRSLGHVRVTTGADTDQRNFPARLTRW